MKNEKNGELEGRVLTLNFWNIMAKMLLLPDKFEGTLVEYGIELDIKINKYFYKVVLPILLKNEILIEIGKESRKYSGRPGVVYKLNKRKLEEFCVKNSLIFRILYKKWGLEGDFTLDLI